MKELSSLSELQSKEKTAYNSSIGVESSQVSTENDHISNVISNLAPRELSKISKRNELKWVMQINDNSEKIGKKQY